MSVQTSDASYLPRLQQPAPREFLDPHEAHQSVLLVEGARQVGKTRLVEEVLQGRPGQLVALNLEREALARCRIDACVRAVANLADSPFKNTTVVPGTSTRVNERINELLAPALVTRF